MHFTVSVHVCGFVTAIVDVKGVRLSQTEWFMAGGQRNFLTKQSCACNISAIDLLSQYHCEVS